MKHRIRAAALITKGDSILLVQQVHPISGEEWWVPPGGGVEDKDDSVFDCVHREVFEETGLKVELASLVYFREFLDEENQARNLELFIEATAFSGDLTIQSIQGTGSNEHCIQDVRWVCKDEIGDMVVYPEILKNGFWDDLAKGFPRTRYLGIQIG